MPIPHLQERFPPSESLPSAGEGRKSKWFRRIAVAAVALIAVVALATAIIIGRRVTKIVSQTGGSLIAPAKLAGLLKDRTVLLLLLNNTELRPGGGFIGTIGIVETGEGTIQSFDTHDVYALDRHGIGVVTKEPPAPMKKYLNVKAWYLRDANWSPDFRASSEETLRAYREEAAAAASDDFPAVDAVVGVTPELFKNLLRLVGPITVSGTTFTPENLTDELEYQVEQKFLETGIPKEQRKEIIGEMGRVLVGRLKTLPPTRYDDVLAVALRALRERHLMIYDPTDATIRKSVADLGWDGAVKDVTHDFLMVVDANLGSLKSDPAVRRTVSYRLEPDGNAFLATVSVTYDHRGTFNWKTTRYRTYTRVYAPGGSQFVRGTGAMENDKLKDPARRPGTFDVGTDLGKAVFGAFMATEPGEKRTLSFTYRVPERVANDIRRGTYRLLVQKQLGTIAHNLTLDLDFGKKLTSATPPENPSAFGDSHYTQTTDLREDRIFEIHF